MLLIHDNMSFFNSSIKTTTNWHAKIRPLWLFEHPDTQLLLNTLWHPGFVSIFTKHSCYHSWGGGGAHSLVMFSCYILFGVINYMTIYDHTHYILVSWAFYITWMLRTFYGDSNIKCPTCLWKFPCNMDVTFVYGALIKQFGWCIQLHMNCINCLDVLTKMVLLHIQVPHSTLHEMIDTKYCILINNLLHTFMLCSKGS